MSNLVGEWTTRPPFVRRINVMRCHSGIPPNRIGISWSQILTPRDRNIALVSRFLPLRGKMVACVHVIGEEELLWYFHLDLLSNHDSGSSVLPVTIAACSFGRTGLSLDIFDSSIIIEISNERRGSDCALRRHVRCHGNRVAPAHYATAPIGPPGWDGRRRNPRRAGDLAVQSFAPSG